MAPSVQQQQLVQTEGLGRFTEWLFEQIRPFIRGTVWEAGCGIGTYTRYMLAVGCQRVIATDHDQPVLDVTRRMFHGDDRVRTCNVDLGRAEEFEKLHGEAIDTIVCLNVLEHIEDDAMVLRQMHGLLSAHGRLVLLVPAHPWLFNGIDRSVHHWRRYTRTELDGKLVRAGFRVVRLSFFNALAIVGWWLYGSLLRRARVPETPAAGFDRLVPFLRWSERVILRGRLGISLIAIAER